MILIYVLNLAISTACAMLRFRVSLLPMKKPVLTPLAESLPATVPFVGPEAAERAMGHPFKARLGANESVFGPSPKVIQAIEKSSEELWMYGDPESHDLRIALAKQLNVQSDEVVVGEGIDGLLGYAVRLFSGPGDTVVTSDGAYPTFNYHVAGYGAQLVKIPYKNDFEDAVGLAAKAHETGARMVYFANPDNPMGSVHDAAVVQQLIDALPDQCLLVLDEAYIEFAPDGSSPPIDTSNPQVIRMRTFSKGYGLAGARVGYAIGHRDTIKAFEKVRNHFGMNRAAQIGAIAALDDQEYLSSVRETVAAGRKRIAEIARQNGLLALPSATNFVTIDCGKDAAFAKSVLDALEARGLFVRMPFAEPGNRCIRISVGHNEDLDLFEQLLPIALKEATG